MILKLSDVRVCIPRAPGIVCGFDLLSFSWRRGEGAIFLGKNHNRSHRGLEWGIPDPGFAGVIRLYARSALSRADWVFSVVSVQHRALSIEKYPSCTSSAWDCKSTSLNRLTNSGSFAARRYSSSKIRAYLPFTGFPSAS